MRAGDKIVPLGAPGSQLFSDYLTNRKISRPLREALPLVAKGNQILWAVGVGIAQQAAVRPGDRALRLQFVPEEKAQITTEDETDA